MTALQTNFILATLATLANSVLHSNTIGIISSYIYSSRDLVELSRPDYCFMPQSLRPTSGDSVSVDLPRGPLLKSFRLSSMSGLTRKV
jgi:hypothetical protein